MFQGKFSHMLQVWAPSLKIYWFNTVLQYTWKNLSCAGAPRHVGTRTKLSYWRDSSGTTLLSFPSPLGSIAKMPPAKLPVAGYSHHHCLYLSELQSGSDICRNKKHRGCRMVIEHKRAPPSESTSHRKDTYQGRVTAKLRLGLERRSISTSAGGPTTVKVYHSRGSEIIQKLSFSVHAYLTPSRRGKGWLPSNPT